MAPKPKANGRRLKVYWAEIDGLNDWVVAAPNRADALKALGVHQDLFAQGEAGDASDSAAIDTARAQPLTPLRRPKGSSKPFAPATGFTDWSAAIAGAKPPTRPKTAAPTSTGAKARPAPPPEPKPDRRPLDRAEARLAEVEARHRQALERLADDQARLDERRAREEAGYADEAAEAKRALKEAERAWRKAGGA